MVFKKKCHISGIIYVLTHTSFFNPCPMKKLILKIVASSSVQGLSVLIL